MKKRWRWCWHTFMVTSIFVSTMSRGIFEFGLKVSLTLGLAFGFYMAIEESTGKLVLPKKLKYDKGP